MARRRTVLTLSFFLCAGSALAAQTAPVATLTDVSGNVMVDSGKGFVPAQDGAALTAGARVLIGRNSVAKIAYSGVKDCVQLLNNRGVTKVHAACPSMVSAMTRSIVSGSVTPAAMALPVVYGVSSDGTSMTTTSGTTTSGTTLATGSFTSGGTTVGTVDSSTTSVSTGSTIGTGTSVSVVTGGSDFGGAGSVDVSTGTGSSTGGVVGGVLGSDNSGTVGSGSSQVVSDSGVVSNTPGAVLGTIAFGDVSTDPAREASPSPTL